MRFTAAIDEFIADKRSAGQINSDRTEVSYRSRLEAHARDVDNRDPRKTGRDDVKRTLRRWEHPNTQANARAILVSFYDWLMEEGLRETNPARQTRRPRRRKATVYRLTIDECIALMDAAVTARERRVVYLGLLAGVRNAELRGLQRRHFERVGDVWVSADIAKGGRERYVPVLPELVDVVDDIERSVGPGEYVIPARRAAGGMQPGTWRERPDLPASPQAIWNLVSELGRRAGIAAHIHPHVLRHAFGDHAARQAGIRAANAALGHASLDTTEGTYTGGMSRDEVRAAFAGFSYRGYAPARELVCSTEAPSGIEPEDSPTGAGTGDLDDHDPGGSSADARDGPAGRTT